jgi:hypothetical protein
MSLKMDSLLHSITTFAETSTTVSELLVQLDSIKEELVMAKMENESIAAKLLVVNDTLDEAI